MSTTLHGTIIAAYGRRHEVELDDGRLFGCVTRGKKTDLACGDRVDVTPTAEDEGVIERIHPRTSLLYRSNLHRTKLLAANVTQMIIVLATQPSFYEALLNRCLVAAQSAGVRALIVLNKCDLNGNPLAMSALERYRQLGYPVLQLAAINDIEPLRPWIEGQRSVLVGQSGMGKSTIINKLIPDINVKTQEISRVLDSGKHTTTAARLYHVNANSQLIDSPGLQEFGLRHLDAAQLEQAFIEFRPLLGKCRFNNCRHLQEPGCAVLDAAQAGRIHATRLDSYQTLRQEIEA